MIRLLYVHGYLGKGNGSAAQHLREALEKSGIRYTLDSPDFPVTNPERMKETLDSLLSEGGYDCVIASSLGAFYVMQAAGPERILVNPALPENLRTIREKNPEGNPALTNEFLDALQNRCDTFFGSGAWQEFGPRTRLLYGTLDTVAGNEEFFDRYFHDESRIFHVDMEHRLDDAGAEKVCEILETMDTQLRPAHLCCHRGWL